jgi:hypothetical protein
MARGGLYLGGYLGPTTYLGPPVPMGRAAEASSATALRRVKGRPVAAAVDAQLARPMGRRKLRGTGQAAELSTAAVTRPLKRHRIGPGRDRQKARPIRRGRVLEPVVEHELAQPMRPTKRRRIGQAVEVSIVCTFHTAGYVPGYGLTPWGEGPYGDPLPAVIRKRRRVGPGRDRQRARPINPT